MPTAEPSARTSFDAGELWSFLVQPWRELQHLPLLVWLAPLPAVHVLHANGSEALWLGDRLQASDTKRREAAPFVAVEVPREEHLELPVKLPAMPAADRQDALALELRMASPFDAADQVWGWREAAPRGTDAPLTAVLASRKAVQARLDGQRERFGRRGPPEAWAFDSLGRPVVLQGFGEAARQRQAARGRWLVWTLLLTALLLAAAAALTPTVQLKLRAMQAVRSMAALEQQLGPVLAQREALVKAQGQRDALGELMAERVEPLAVLDLVTQAVPDDTWVQRLQLQGAKLTLSGPTPNTAALMNRFSSLPQVRDVRSPVAATRAQSGRENYTIELTLLPEALRPPGVATATNAAAAPSAPAHAPVAPAAAAASASVGSGPVSPAPAVAPARTSAAPAAEAPTVARPASSPVIAIPAAPPPREALRPPAPGPVPGPAAEAPPPASPSAPVFRSVAPAKP